MTALATWPAVDAAAYRAGTPWPHLVLDGVLDGATVSAAAAEGVAAAPSLPRSHDHRLRKSESSAGTGPEVAAVLAAVESPEATAWLRDLTGIDDLEPDPSHLLGGVHASRRGDHQSLHVDFVRHGTSMLWHRVNVLVYLSGWEPAWGGELLLHDPRGLAQDELVVPAAGRVVVYETHGLTQHAVLPLRSPDGVWRVSAVSYWYSRTPPPGPLRRPRLFRPALPSDGRLARLAPVREVAWGHRPTLDAATPLSERLRHLLRRP